MKRARLTRKVSHGIDSGNARGRILRRQTLARHSDFNDMVSSLIVNRGRWELCSDARFRGNCKVYGPGRYPNVRGNNDEYASIRRVN
ncbi:MAG: beta/gamma crystallin family protein [Burkholderiales bacterium]|nr:beta/gamma crystallin family protein [Burkholderiales bacterium]